MRRFKVSVNGKTYEVDVEEREYIEGESIEKNEVKEINREEESIKAPMPGNVWKFGFKEGDQVKSGDILMVLEAMKMENEILAPRDGIIGSIAVSEGDSVNTGDILITLK